MGVSAQVLVIGTGGVGAAAAFHLAKRGVDAVGIDRFPGGHDRGSSHGHSRIIRLAYFEHRDYVPLLRRAYQLWHDLEHVQGEQLFMKTGLLEIGRAEGPTIQGILSASRTHNLKIDQLSAEECRRRFPGFVVPDDLTAIFEETAGVLRVERCVLAHLDQARKAGAKLVVGETVQAWSATSTAVEVTTDANTYRADRLIITAGAWSGALLRSLGVPLPVKRKHLHWYPGPAATIAEENGCPAFYYESADGDFYGIPAFDGFGLKAGEHTGGAIVDDPLGDDRSVEAADRRRVEAFLDSFAPTVARPALDHRTCFYTMSPDGHFLIDRHPEHANVMFAAGLSGHGFKFSGVLGEALADLAMHGRTELPIDFLSLKRFASAPR